MIRTTSFVVVVAGAIMAGAAGAVVAKPQPKRTQVVRATPISPARAGHCENPQWSRDGKALAYERVFLQDRKIELDVLTDVFGRPKERKVEIPPLEGAEAAAQRAASRFRGPDASRLAHGEVCREFAWGPKSDPDIFAHSCNVQGQTYQLFWSEGAQLTEGGGANGQPALSPVGWRLAYVSASRGAEGLALVDDLVEGSPARPLVRTRGRVDRMPVWDPSGRMIAFVGHTEDGADLYWIKDLDRAAETLIRLTDWPGDELNPSWSPDGRKLAFFASRRKAKGRKSGYDLYVLDVSKTEAPKAVRVAKNVGLNEKRGPSWTPDSRYLVFIKNLQRGKLVDPVRAVAATGGPEFKLKTGTVSNQDPAVTVHGDRWWLAFTSLGYYNAKKLAWRRVFIFPMPRRPSS